MKFNVGLKFRRLEAVRNLVFVQTFPFREVFVLLMAAGYTFRTYTLTEPVIQISKLKIKKCPKIFI